MRLGMLAGQFGPKLQVPFDLIEEAERLGYDSVWTAEAYGNDAIAPLSFIAARTTKIKVGTAIMQMPARTPAMTAMTAMSLDALSGGRFVLGLGPSGPQVVEGWHGVPYGRPLTRTREYITIVRDILRTVSELRDKGVSVLLVEQNARAALAIADHAYVMELGEVTLQGPASELAADPRIAEVYLGVAHGAAQRHRRK